MRARTNVPDGAMAPVRAVADADGWRARGMVPSGGPDCLVDLGTGHVLITRPDGTTYCGTCHPPLRGPVPTTRKDKP
jgi:hypothetical protein